jgi:hypothetical protein
MEWKILIPASIASIVAVVGWVIGHRFNSERDLKNNQRQLRLKYLIEAYDTFLELGGNVDILGNYRAVEKSVHDLQLFGTPEHIRLCKKFVDDVTTDGKANHNELVIAIRNFIRDELGLEIMDEKHFSLKIEPIKKNET